MYPALEDTTGKRAAAMGRRDEDDPAHLWNRLIAEHLLEEPAVLGRAADLLDGLLADRLPEARSASCTIIFARMPPRLWPTTTIRSKAASLPSGSKTRRARRKDRRSRWAEKGMASPLA